MHRGKLGLLSATNAADSGDVDRAVHLLRGAACARHPGRPGRATARQPGQQDRRAPRLYLWTIDDVKAMAEAVDIARATVDETPAQPPTWQYARAVATYANTLLVDDDYDLAREQAEQALAAARAADAPWVQADALVTLGYLSNREGRNDEAIKLLTQAHKQAREAKVLGVELRAAYHLARAHLERGDLAAGGAARTRAPSGPTRPGSASRPTAPTCSTCTSRPLRRRQLGPRPGDRGRLPGPRHEHPRGLPVLDGPVHRRRARQPGGGGTARLDRAVPARPRIRRVHRARAVRRARPLAGRRRAGPGRGAGRDHLVYEPPWGFHPAGHQGRGGRAGRPGRPGHRHGPPATRRPRPPSWPRPPTCCETAREGAAFPSGPSSSSAPKAAAGWPGPRRSTAGPAATTTRRPGRRSSTRSAPSTSTRRPAPGGGWPRRWPRQGAGTRRRSSGARRPRRRTGWPPVRCAGRSTTSPAGPGSGPPNRAATARSWPR